MQPHNNDGIYAYLALCSRPSVSFNLVPKVILCKPGYRCHTAVQFSEVHIQTSHLEENPRHRRAAAHFALCLKPCVLNSRVKAGSPPGPFVFVLNLTRLCGLLCANSFFSPVFAAQASSSVPRLNDFPSTAVRLRRDKSLFVRPVGTCCQSRCL